MVEGTPVDWRHDAAAAAIILVMIPLLLWSIDFVGPTIDEPFHLVRGLAWWWTDSTKLSYAHPPLANALQALPAVLLYEPMALTEVAGWDTANHAQMAEQLVMSDYPKVRAMLWAGRFVTMAMMVALCFGVYRWTSKRLGAWTGLIALALVAFNPTMLAHAQLLTTDLPVAASLFLLAATFVDYIAPRRRGPVRSWVQLAGFAAAMAIALGTKFTAVSMIPLLGIVGIVWALAGWGRFEGGSRGRNLARVALDAAVVAIVAVVVLGALYRFEEFGLTVGQILEHPEPQCHLTETFEGEFLEQRLLSSMLPRWLPLPVPYTWWFGFEMVRFHGAAGHPTWFAGISYGMGNPAYFPVMLLIKNPVLWVLGNLALTVTAIRARRWLPGPLAIPALMGVGMLLLLSISNLNIGVRHALPIVLLWSIPAAAGLVHATRRFLQGSFVRGAVVAALLATLPVIATAYGGHYLGYFNIGRLGYAISVVGEDWGQDSIHLIRAVKEHEMKPLRYVTYGMGGLAELKREGIRPSIARCGMRYPKWGWLVIHRSMVVRWDVCTAGVNHRPPDVVIANHIFAWDLSKK